MSGVQDHHTLASTGDGTGSDPVRLVPGALVAGYRIDRLIGSGGMGSVYAATDVEIGRKVALKVIAAPATTDTRARELFVRETMNAAALEHPHILPIYRGGEDAGLLYIAMRLVDGLSLQELVDQLGPLPAHRAARIASEIASALDVAHARGLVHRDVKPANILIADPGEDEHAYLADFGLATAAGGTARWAGTLAFTAPEQLAGKHVDGRADTYALGCTLFFALTGQTPYTVTDEASAYAEHANAPLPQLLRLAPNVPAGLDAVIRQALAKEPAERFATTGGLGQAAMAARFDVAVCAHPDDHFVATAIAEQLTDRGLSTVVADAGRPSEAVHAAGSCVVLIGSEGLGAWSRNAVIAAHAAAAADRSFRLVSALLPGAPGPLDPSLAFLATHPWADLRDDGNSGGEAILRVLRGVSPQRLGDAAGEDCPYRGLEAFSQEHAQDFFGREVEVERVLEQIRASRFVAILGPSGSGKSSLIQAGVLPRLIGGADSTPWHVIDMTPGEHPLAALSVKLGEVPGVTTTTADQLGADDSALDAAVAGLPGGHRALIVVDQCEEAFTLCTDPTERSAFFSALAFAATVPAGRVIALISCRTDFYHRLTEHDALRQLASASQVAIGPMSAANLRRAIERPARRAGLELEPGLTRRVLTDLSDSASLPLLEHLLLELWHRRSGNTLTLGAYDAAGGVTGSLARRAEDTFGALSEDQQVIARRLLMRLTQPGEGTEDTRRRCSKSELLTTGDAAAVEQVIDALAHARLVTTGIDAGSGEPAVDVTHEALIRGWPRLRSWIDESREQLRLHRRLTDASREWSASGRDDALLLRGSSLAAWHEQDRSELNPVEREFLELSTGFATREQSAKTRRARMTIGALSAAVVAIGAVATVAMTARSSASHQRDIARSREIAANAQLQLSTNPELAGLIAREGYRIAPTAQTVSVLRQALAATRVRTAVQMHDGAGGGIAISADGRRGVSAGEDGTVKLFDPTQPKAPATVIGRDLGSIRDVAISRDGTLAVAVGEVGVLYLWNGNLQSAPRRVTVGKTQLSRVALSRDMRLVAVGDIAGTITLLRTRGAPAPQTLTAGKNSIAGLALSRDGSTLISSERFASTVRLRRWNTSTGTSVAIGPSHVQGIADVALANDGQLIAAAGEDAKLTAGDLARPQAMRTLSTGSAGWSSVAIDDTSSVIAAGATDGTITLWRRDRSTPLRKLTGHDGAVTAVAFIPGTDQLVGMDDEGVARWYDWRSTGVRLVSPVHGDVVIAAAVAADGTHAETISYWGEVQRLDFTQPQPTKTIIRFAGDSAGGWADMDMSGDWVILEDDYVHVQFAVDGRSQRFAPQGFADGLAEVDLSPDGHWVAVGDTHGRIQLFDTTATPPEPVFTVSDSRVYSANLTVASDGSIASAKRDGGIARWRGSDRRRSDIARGRSDVRSLAFSPDGRYLAFGTLDGTMGVLDQNDALASAVMRHTGSVEGIDFADGSRLLVSAGDEVRVTDWTTGALITSWDVGRLAVAQYSATTHQAVAVGERGTDLLSCDTCGSPTQLLQLADTRLTRALTADERAAFVQPRT